MKKCICILLCVLLLAACSPAPKPALSGEAVFSLGFATQELRPDPENSYLAGYHNGQAPQGVLDAQRVKALWLDDGRTATVLICVDCVGLDSGTVSAIRQALEGFCRETGCASVHVISTHTHAGVDTLGLWGPEGLSGKNGDFMDALVSVAAETARDAYADRRRGDLYFSKVPTQGLQRDTRFPVVFDKNLYRLRFAPEDGSPGIRILNYAVHPEALGGENSQVSADFPGRVSRLIQAQTGERVLFMPGAIGGLIAPVQLSPEPEENLELYSVALTEYALSATEEQRLEPSLKLHTQEFTTELENTLFLYYKFLGILGNPVSRRPGGTYSLRTQLSVLQLGEVTLALVPGEIFPELVLGGTDSKSLTEIADEHGVKELLIVGLADDELGYILPPESFVLHDRYPYVQEAPGDHYEETNSVGPGCYPALAEAFEKALAALK